MEAKKISVSNDIDDSLIGGNASAEEAAEVCVCVCVCHGVLCLVVHFIFGRRVLPLARVVFKRDRRAPITDTPGLPSSRRVGRR